MVSLGTAFADDSDFSTPRLGVISVLATDNGHGTSMGMGLGVYSQTLEVGVTASGYIKNANEATSLGSLVIYGGGRVDLTEKTYLAVGATFLQNFGHENGLHVDREYEIGPYISLEQMLTHHVLIGGWILPYQYDYEKLAGMISKEHEIFSAGGITLNYFF